MQSGCIVGYFEDLSLSRSQNSIGQLVWGGSHKCLRSTVNCVDIQKIMSCTEVVHQQTRLISWCMAGLLTESEYLLFLAQIVGVSVGHTDHLVNVFNINGIERFSLANQFSK